jgi:large subunit ribosomal protein L21
MYAVIHTGGKQYKAEPGRFLKIGKLEQAVGDNLEFDKILLVDNGEHLITGTPYVAGAKVIAEVVKQGRTAKVYTVKLKRRAHHLKRATHRQHFTQIKIKDIMVSKEVKHGTS